MLLSDTMLNSLGRLLIKHCCILSQTAFLVLFYAVLQGCTAFPKESAVAESQYYQWANNRQQMMQQISSWRWQGRALIQNNEQVQSLNMAWFNQKDAIQLQLSGPFGLGAATIDINARGAMLSMGNKVVRAASLTELVSPYLMWPVSSRQMQAWFWGIATTVKHAEFNQASQLVRLQDGDWTLDFGDYRKIQGVIMPYKIRVQKGENLFKLKISQWQLS